MGSTAPAESTPCKPHYDISMSKRTRKPTLHLEETRNDPLTGSSPKRSVVQEKEESDLRGEVSDEQRLGTEDNDHKSLRELIVSIIGDEEDYDKEMKPSDDQGNSGGKLGRSSLGQHFSDEEKQLQLVRRQKQVVQGLKLKGLVGRYVKVLRHFIKVKQVEARKNNVNLGSTKPLLQLGM